MANNRLRKLIDILVCFFAGSLFAWGITCGILSYIYNNPPYVRIFLYISIIMLALRVIFYNKYTAAAVSAVTAGALLLFLYNIRVNPELAENIQDALDFIFKVIMYIGGYEQYTQAYETAVTFMLCGTVAVLTFIFILPRFGFYVLFGLAAGSYGIILSSGGLPHSLAFTACITGLLILFARSRGARVYRPAGAFAMAIVLLCVGAAQLLPVPEQGFAASVTDTVIYRPFRAANRYISSFFAPKYFSLSSTGHMRSDNILGGDIELTDDVVMEVSVFPRPLGRIYLTGAIKDRYTGYSWENTTPEYFPHSFSDKNTALLERMFSNILISQEIGEIVFLAMLLANPSYLPQTHLAHRAEYIHGGTLTIQMQKSLYSMRRVEINVINGRTFTVFTEGIPVNIEKNGQPLPLRKDGAGNLSASRLMSRNSPYTLYFRTDPLIPAFNAIEELSRRGVYREIYAEFQRARLRYDFDKRQLTALLDQTLDREPTNMHMLKMYPPGADFFDPEISVIYEDFLKYVLIPRADEIYRRYTVLPENLPQRVADLALEITERDDNKFGKAMAIRRFLRQFPYTKTPGDTPEGRDFVDYFLFDLQKGYCTYFATAFVVMCRAVGIPARYVTGFVTPAQADENGVYIITNKQGHAWAEIYLEGYGWRRFEPTPSENSTGRLSMLPSAENYPLTNEAGELLTIGTGPRSADFNILRADEEQANINMRFFSALQSDYQNTDLLSTFSLNLMIAVLLVSSAFILYIMLRYFIERRYIYKISGKKNNDAAVEYYKIILKYLRFFNYEKSRYETVIQFAERTNGEFADVAIIKVSDILSKVFYGNGEISSDDINLIKQALSDLDNKLVSSAGRIKYLYFRYLKRLISVK